MLDPLSLLFVLYMLPATIDICSQRSAIHVITTNTQTVLVSVPEETKESC